MLERYPLFRMFLLLGQHLGRIFLTHPPNVIKSREVVLATPQLPNLCQLPYLQTFHGCPPKIQYRNKAKRDRRKRANQTTAEFL